jgi:hypothetical protein
MPKIFFGCCDPQNQFGARSLGASARPRQARYGDLLLFFYFIFLDFFNNFSYT